MNPLVSVIMAAYNAEEHINEAIKSIVKQTFTDWELIIVNDASTDKSRDVIKSFQDERIILIDNKVNLGSSRSRNLAINKSVGKFIAIMDADDVALMNRLQVQTEFLNNHPKIKWCGSWYQEILGDRPGKLIKSISNEKILDFWGLIYSPAANSSVMCYRNILENNELFISTHEPAEDFELWSRLLARHCGVNIPKVLIRYRIHPNSLSKRNRDQQIESVNRIIERNTKKYIDDFTVHDRSNYAKVYELYQKYCQFNHLDFGTKTRLAWSLRVIHPTYQKLSTVF